MEKLAREDLIKHWLLNTAIDFPRPLIHVLPKVQALTLNAREVSGCAPEGYAQRLRELYLSGNILFTSEDPTDDARNVSGVDAILDRFLGCSYEPPDVRDARGKRQADPRAPKIPRVLFSLAESGGALWESVAKPEWDHFYKQSSDYEAGDAVSPDLTLLMARLGWFPELSGEAIDVQSIQLEECSDYPVLYWETLPRVYRATFKCQGTEARWKTPEYADHPIEPDWFRKWWPTTVRLYSEPWVLPDWPRSA
jgi:hypothetical protein